ncbi:MAG: DEAD/DEAH box helicase [Nocardioidaceae bacterium]
MVDLSLLLDDADLRRRFGAPTVQRAEQYVARGRVSRHTAELGSRGDLEIRGWVAGSAGWPYLTTVSVTERAGELHADTSCSCPVGSGCKHAVALLLTVRAEQARDGAAVGAAWERHLTSLLDELDDAAGRQTRSAHKPLALQVELSHPSRTARHRAWAPAPTSPRGVLQVRPLQRGARDNWVRTGISWQQMPYLDQRHGQHPPDQVAVLNEMLTAFRAATRQTYLGSETHLAVRSFGSSLWGLLADAARAGLVLVPAGALTSVAVAEHPATMQFDVHGSRGGAVLDLGVRSAGEWYAVRDLDVLGDTGHGVALWRPDGDAWAVTLAPLAEPVGPGLRRMIASGGSMAVPQHARGDLVAEYLPRLQRHLPVVSSDGTVAVPEPAEPRLVLAVTWVSVEEARIAWTWRYRVGADDRVYGLAETRGLRGVRRPDAERALLAGLDLTDEQRHRLFRGAELVPEQTFRHGGAIAFAEDVLPVLEKQVEVEEIGGRPRYQEASGAPVIRFAGAPGGDGGAEHAGGSEVDARTDWLELEVVITVDGQAIALGQLLEALTNGRTRVILKNGWHVAVDRPEFAHLAELVQAAGELHEQPRDGVRVSHHDLGLWDELAEIGLVDEQAAQWVRAAQALRSLSTLPTPEQVGLQATLRSYQREGFHWLAFLWESGLGGILADDMGLGKTLQTLALVAYARSRGAGPFLVVAPTSVVSTWAHEAARFTPGLVVRTVTESHSRRGTTIAELADGADVVVTSYTLYRLEADAYVPLGWGGLVLDEAQTVKNHNGKTYQAVRRLDVPFRLAVTGTPMENRLMELWSLLSIVAPGLYPWPQRFVELVANPVERLGDKQVLERFRRRIRPFLLRRTKELVASDLPPKQEQVLEVSLTSRHRKIYETHLQKERQTVLGLVEDFDKHRIAIFRSLTRLRQLSLDAALVDPAYDGVGSAKTDVLTDHLLEVVSEGHRALVFSQFTSFLKRVRTRLEAEQIATAYLDGSTRNRGAVVDGFKRGEAEVFLISLKAGGVGLTLTEADYCFVLDPWWNPAVEAQAVDRAHRIGQQRPVMVYRMVATDTIEEKVMELKARKAALFAQVVDDGELMSSALGADDVRALFED